MTPALALARCLHHPMREAVCRCPVCTRYFCRECITEHEGQFLCSRCVAELPGLRAPRSPFIARLLTGALTLGAFVLMVAFFYLLGVIVAVNHAGGAG